MKNKSIISILVLLVAYSVTVIADDTPNSSSYQLKEDAEAEYKLKETLNEKADNSENNGEILSNTPQIVKEEIPGGQKEKLLDKEGKVIAEKIIKNGNVAEKVLYYYYPEGTVSRQVHSKEGSFGFYAKDFYKNGQVAIECNYINEDAKIGKEKKYDIKGALRQEITWELPKSEEDKPVESRKTVRAGIIKTYYPSGKLAAKFTLSPEKENIFYDEYGSIIKKISKIVLLNFAPEINKESCKNNVIKLTLGDMVELYEDEGDISYNVCGVPYRENFANEIIEIRGMKATNISFDDTGMIRKITPYYKGAKEGIEKKYDASGNLTAEINYKEGLKSGTAKGYFPTGEVAFSKDYENGKVKGKLICYFPNQNKAAEFSYIDGKKQGESNIYGANARTLIFKDDKIISSNGVALEGNDKKEEHIIIPTMLKELANKDSKCLNFAPKLEGLNLDIVARINTIRDNLKIKVPENCQDFSKDFKIEKGQYVCKDEAGQIRATFPIDYIKNDYVISKIYDTEGKTLYNIPYLNKQRQGFARRVDENGNTEIEVYYNHDKTAGSAKGYYKNGGLKEVITYAENSDKSVITEYNEQAKPIFSINFAGSEKTSGFIANKDKNKDTYITYYQDKPEYIREVNMSIPGNYIEYNLPLNEYAVYQNYKLVRGGDICGKDEIIKTSSEIKEDKIENKTVASTEQPIVNNEQNLKIKNAIIPTSEEKQKVALAAENIGPVQKPDIEDLADVVEKQHAKTTENVANEELSATEKFYYPNSKLRKTIKTTNGRTEEIKEYSKTGLLLTDTIYQKDGIVIEKYFGSGEVRRKTNKAYTDNAILAFVSRMDFYDNGNLRYEIERTPETLLFSEKTYYPDGKLKSEIVQTGALSFTKKDYDKKENIEKITISNGINILSMYYQNNVVTRLLLNDKEIPVSFAKDSNKLLEDNHAIYSDTGVLEGTFDESDTKTTIAEYYQSGKPKTEIVFYNNGEISVKSFNKEEELVKFAYLSPEGKLHIQKPDIKTIPAYRERYWVDYNNPHWIENADKYDIEQIAYLSVKITDYILQELNIENGKLWQKIKARYNK